MRVLLSTPLGRFHYDAEVLGGEGGGGGRGPGGGGWEGAAFVPRVADEAVDPALPCLHATPPKVRLQAISFIALVLAPQVSGKGRHAPRLEQGYSKHWQLCLEVELLSGRLLPGGRRVWMALWDCSMMHEGGEGSPLRACAAGHGGRRSRGEAPVAGGASATPLKGAQGRPRAWQGGNAVGTVGGVASIEGH